MSKHEEQAQENPSRFFTVFGLVVLFLMLLMVSGVIYLRRPDVLPIETVLIRGEVNPADQVALEKIIFPAVQTNFFDVDLDALQAAIQQLPSVSQAMVQRVWPSTIVINISAQRPVAVWNGNRLISDFGEIFQMSLSDQQAKNLPKFVGQEDLAVQILSYYQQMNEILSPLQFHVTDVLLRPGKFWQITLDNGVILKLGRTAVLDRLQRFVNVYPKIVSQRSRRAKEIDLQYDNGMAVKWQ